MKSFDWVSFQCYNCGKEVSVVSRAGECDAKGYKWDDVPVDIAIDVDGEQVHCARCSSVFEIKSPVGKRVSLLIEEVK